MALMGHVVLSTQGQKYLDQKTYKANKAVDLIHLTFLQQVWEQPASESHSYLESWEVIST